MALLIWLLLKAGDFHPLWLPVCGAGTVWLLLTGRVAPGTLGTQLLAMLVLTSAVQIVFMGIPMALAARSPLVPFRMYANSFAVLAPTTISLPLTLFYQVFILASAGSLDPLRDPPAVVFLLALAGGALLVRRFRKRQCILWQQLQRRLGLVGRVLLFQCHRQRDTGDNRTVQRHRRRRPGRLGQLCYRLRRLDLAADS